MTENNFNFTNGVSYDVWYESKRLIDQLKKENEELKEYIQANKATGICETCTHTALIENDHYRKALKEIEVYIQSQLDGFGNDVYAMNKVAINHIQDIINKAKGN